MGITIPRGRLEEVLERAIVLAESEAELPPIWIDRARRIGECPSKTYVAALGTALLAKASDAEVDALAIKSKAGPRAYSMRGVVKVLVEKAQLYGYDLGVSGPEPLNNQPWFGADRVDRMENVHRDSQACQREIVRMLSDLNKASQEEALLALGAFLRVRIDIAEQQRAASALVVAARPHGLGELTDLLSSFIRNDPEGGRRGQALVAALLELGQDEVSLGAINDPWGIDVAVTDAGRLLLPVEVKQKAVDEDVALRTARRAAEQGADKALLVALAPDQRPVDRERIRRQAREEYGVTIAVWESVEELVHETAMQTPLTSAEIAEELPGRYLRRMEAHEVSLEGRQYFADLVAALAAREQAN